MWGVPDFLGRIVHVREFFDKRVVEFCLALPWDQKVRGGWSKRIVRLATSGLVPDDVRWRRGRWVRLGWSFSRGVIAGDRHIERVFLKSGSVEHLGELVRRDAPLRFARGARTGRFSRRPTRGAPAKS